MHIEATRAKEAAATGLAIGLANTTTRERKPDDRLRKVKTNQLAKNQDVILPKLDTGEGQEMDVKVQLKKHTEQLEVQGAPQGSSSQGHEGGGAGSDGQQEGSR